MKKNRNLIDAFFALVKAGLWEQEAQLLPFGYLDISELYQLAEEQSVVGLIVAGLEHVKDNKANKEDLLQVIGTTLQLEERNKAMNVFVGNLISEMRHTDIYCLLVKGQGVAQCYERPLWRASGDVDLYLSEDNFQRARVYFRPLVESEEIDDNFTKSINMHYGDWVVEIHASQHCGLSSRIDKVLDDIHGDLFYGGNVRSCELNGTQVFIPSADNDILIVFTHFLKHFYKGGLGLRQICDWCRLLWTYRSKLNLQLLESRIHEMGLMSEWRAFGAFAVNYLGMPADAMPFYSSKVQDVQKFKRKADRICSFIMEVGNMGHNRDSSYYVKYPYVIRKAFSFSRRLGDLYRHARIFPLDSFRFLPSIVFNGVRSVIKGE